MKAAIMIPGPDGGTWEVRDVQRPVVAPGQVLVRVHASSINRAEFRRLGGLRDGDARTGGGDAAGEVVAVGSGVTGIKEGDRIMGRGSGCFAEFALIDAREVMPAPKTLDWAEAASVPVVFVVVHDGLFASGQLHPGETLLVTAAPSGVGTAALTLGKLIGARVIGTSRSAEKLERLKAYGLDVGVVTGADGLAESVKAAAGDKGVDMVVDNIGADAMQGCLDTLNVGGRMVTIGRMSGVHSGELNIDRFAERRLHLYGVSNRLRTNAQRAESAKRFMADLFPALEDGRLKPIVDRTFPLDDITAAQAHVEADRHVGKVVITM
ncbi:MAG TPA: zinc-binding dehydrogenase [Stellaceae bacterium]|jgi:NADPH:quinone reductase-like Zn-dependent oxidoreductase